QAERTPTVRQVGTAGRAPRAPRDAAEAERVRQPPQTGPAEGTAPAVVRPGAAAARAPAPRPPPRRQARALPVPAPVLPLLHLPAFPPSGRVRGVLAGGPPLLVPPLPGVGLLRAPGLRQRLPARGPGAAGLSGGAGGRRG